MPANQSTDWLLIVDDQLDVWILLQAHLKRGLPTLPMVHFSEPASAFGYLQQCIATQQPLPGMILSDLYLPQRAVGLDFLAQLKAPASPFVHLPVVIISSSTQDSDRQAVNHLGGTFLAKPVSPAQWSEFVTTISHYWHKRPQLGP